MTSRFYPAALLLLTSLPAAAGALYKCSDGGATTYTNNRDGYRSCIVVSRDGPAVTAPSGGSSPRPKAASNPSPVDFPRVSSDTQKARDTDRQHILEQEVATEQKGLDEARKTLAEQEAARAPADRLQPYRDRIALHSRNLDALRRELGKVK
jgi:hypothetical protein